MADEISDDPARFEEAIRAFRARVPMTDAEWSALEDAAKARAFTVAEVADADIITDAWAAIDDAVTNGTSFEEFAATIGDALEGAWGGERPGRLETIYRTNVMSAYNQGRQELLNNETVKEQRPYWRFDGINDDRQSEICAPLDGKVLPADDPWWASHTPPLHFQCRSIITPLSDEEAQAEGVAEEAPRVSADDGFGSESASLDDFEPDLNSYPPEIRDRVADAFK